MLSQQPMDRGQRDDGRSRGCYEARRQAAPAAAAAPATAAAPSAPAAAAPLPTLVSIVGAAATPATPAAPETVAAQQHIVSSAVLADRWRRHWEAKQTDFSASVSTSAYSGPPRPGTAPTAPPAAAVLVRETSSRLEQQHSRYSPAQTLHCGSMPAQANWVEVELERAVAAARAVEGERAELEEATASVARRAALVQGGGEELRPRHELQQAHGQLEAAEEEVACVGAGVAAGAAACLAAGAAAGVAAGAAAGVAAGEAAGAAADVAHAAAGAAAGAVLGAANQIQMQAAPVQCEKHLPAALVCCGSINLQHLSAFGADVSELHFLFARLFTPKHPSTLPRSQWLSYTRLFSTVQPYAPARVWKLGRGNLKQRVIEWCQHHPTFAGLAQSAWCVRLKDEDQPHEAGWSQPSVYKFCLECTP